MKAQRQVYFKRTGDQIVLLDATTDLPIEFQGMRENGLYQEFVETAFQYHSYDKKDDPDVDMQMHAEFTVTPTAVHANHPSVDVNMHNPQIHMTVVYDFESGQRTTLR